MAQITINLSDNLKTAIDDAVAGQNNAAFVASGLTKEAFAQKFLATFISNMVRGWRDRKSQEANATQAQLDAASITFE